MTVMSPKANADKLPGGAGRSGSKIATPMTPQSSMRIATKSTTAKVARTGAVTARMPRATKR